jgi:hypothetical protein
MQQRTISDTASGTETPPSWRDRLRDDVVSFRDDCGRPFKAIEIGVANVVSVATRHIHAIAAANAPAARPLRSATP